jgi:hexosaminidase
VSARLFLPNGRASPVVRTRIARATWKEPVSIQANALRPGLTYAYGEGNFTSADDVRDKQLSRVGMVPQVGLRGDERPEQYGVRLSGLLRVPRDALYTFYLVSDDGAKLRIDGDLVVDHDGQHDATEKRGQIALRAGYHPVELVFFQAGGGAALQLAVSAPGVARRPVPSDWFVHTGYGGR